MLRCSLHPSLLMPGGENTMNECVYVCVCVAGCFFFISSVCARLDCSRQLLCFSNFSSPGWSQALNAAVCSMPVLMTSLITKLAVTLSE